MNLQEFAQLLSMFIFLTFYGLDEEVLLCLQAYQCGATAARVESRWDDAIKKVGHKMICAFLVCYAEEKDGNIVHSLAVPNVRIVGNHKLEDSADALPYFVFRDAHLALREEFSQAVVENVRVRPTLGWENGILFPRP